jgi:hypothetical protein
MNTNPYAKQSQMTPATRRVRAYVAPVNRASGIVFAYDPASPLGFDLDSPPLPWLDLGWVENFKRVGTTKHAVLRTGPAGEVAMQYRCEPEALVEFDLCAWGKVQLALSGGTQQMNVLAEQPGRLPEPSGGMALPASLVQGGSTANELVLTADQLACYSVGDIVAVDVDYNGETGYLGSGAPGTYLSTPLTGGDYLDLVRRVTFNVSRVCGKSASSLLLAQPLIAQPATAMSVQKVIAFVDREGSSFFQEWSCLFVLEPDSGGQCCFYYPRVQPAASASESYQELVTPIFAERLHVSLRALPVSDVNDNETVLCYRSYIPAPNAAV